MTKANTPPILIGKSQLIAQILWHDIPELIDNEDLEPLDRCYLFTGPPGTAKSTIALAFAKAMAGHPLNVVHLNGQSVTTELVREWMRQGHYRPLYGALTVHVIDEIDAANNAAMNDMRTWLDTLAPKNVVLATTNKGVKELQPQLQSRFSVSYFEKVPSDTIAKYVMERFELDAAAAHEIADGCDGNVRSAILDARSKLKTIAFLSCNRHGKAANYCPD